MTGGSGLVGSAIKRLFSDVNCAFLSSVDFDLSDMDQTKLAFNKYNPKIRNPFGGVRWWALQKHE